MPRYKSKLTVEANRWFKNGDHPRDESVLLTGTDGEPFLSEGKIVRRFNRPSIEGRSQCSLCGEPMRSHGWIDALDQEVCPGDWVLEVENCPFALLAHEAFIEQFELIE